MMSKWIAYLALVALAAACGGGVGNDGAAVGGSCDGPGDCVERCLTGGDFPQGTCSVACADDGDCPGGSYCVDASGGGSCLLACQLDLDCRPGYSCGTRDRVGAPGEAAVCRD